MCGGMYSAHPKTQGYPIAKAFLPVLQGSAQGFAPGALILAHSSLPSGSMTASIPVRRSPARVEARDR